MNIETLQNMLANGQDNLLLRYGLAQALLKESQPEQAVEHLLKALEFEPDHSAAYKLLGKAYSDSQQNERAITAYENGIEIAERKGDIQAAKEMKVFLKRLLKQQ